MKRTIAVGDPLAKRASFTRFVLPFAWSAWRAEKVDKSSPESSHFRRATAKDWIHSAIENEQVVDEDRCRYFTPETAELLYHRAVWFVLEENEQLNAGPRAVWKTLKVKSGLKDAQHTYQIALRPPALILFEDCPPAGRLGKDDNPDLLRTGFLVIEAFFPDERKAPSFEDMLRFNEVFRFWRCPFEKHATEFCAAELNSIYEELFGSDIAEGRGKNHQRLYTDRWAKLFRRPIMDRPDKSFFVMPQEWLNEDETGSGGNRQRNGDPHWLVQPDDRAFTVACAFLKGDGEVIANPDKKKTRTWTDVVAAGFEEEDATSPIPSLSGHWVKILNIDRPHSPDDDGSCSPFEYQWALERTYRRWAGDGSLYGFTPHSMALMAGVKKLHCELQLLSAAEKSHMPVDGKDLMIVAQVNRKLHFRIFDGAGQIVVDKEEGGLEPALPDELNVLRSKLDHLWEAQGVPEDQKNDIVATVASILDPHGEPPLALHCGRLYFDATLLLFYVRVSLFRFSKRLHDLSAQFRDKRLPEDSPQWKDWAVQVATIRWQFLHFENLYQFPLLSNQQQHLEMYELQRRCMDIQELYQEIDKEVQSSDHVLNAKLDKQRNELDERRNQLAVMLNLLAAVGLGLSVALACFQIVRFQAWIDDWGKWATYATIIWSLLCVFLSLIPIGIWWLCDKRRFCRIIPTKKP